MDIIVKEDVESYDSQHAEEMLSGGGGGGIDQ